MTITKEEALQVANEFLSTRKEDNLKIVDRMDGAPYIPGNLDIEHCWIIYVPSEQLRTGGSDYILVDKETRGIVMVRT